MSGDTRLVVYEGGTETGSITADGEVRYDGDNDYVRRVLARFDGGDVVTHGVETDDEFVAVDSETVAGEALFDGVRARLSPLPDIDVEVHGPTTQE